MLVTSLKDRFKLTIGEVMFTVRPLTYFEQQRIEAFKKIEAGEEVSDISRQCYEYVKMAVMELSGVENANGSNYALERSEDGYLTDECTSEILSLNLGPEFVYAAYQMKYNASKLFNPITQAPLEGVALEIERHL